MLTLNVEMDPAFEAAESVIEADVLAPVARLVVVGFQERVNNEPAFRGFQFDGVMDKVSATFPVFFM